MDRPGTLSTLVKQKGLYPYLINDKGQWVARNDVWYKGVIAAAGSRWLGVSGGRIGPEIGFGHAVGNHYDEPVIILKTSQGNRSLSWDFLAPGSERFEYDVANGIAELQARDGRMVTVVSRGSPNPIRATSMRWDMRSGRIQISGARGGMGR